MILGRFCFRQLENGDLRGAFSNNASNNIFSENADLQTERLVNFQGDYISTWFDERLHSLNLRVRPKDDGLTILTLEWSDNNEVWYLGEGFINEGILIGNYWDSEMNDHIGPLLNS